MTDDAATGLLLDHERPKPYLQVPGARVPYASGTISETDTAVWGVAASRGIEAGNPEQAAQDVAPFTSEAILTKATFVKGLKLPNYEIIGHSQYAEIWEAASASLTHPPFGMLVEEFVGAYPFATGATFSLLVYGRGGGGDDAEAGPEIDAAAATIQDIASLDHLPSARDISRRLTELREILADEDGVDIARGSLETMLAFLRGSRLTRQPAIGASSNGILSAEWSPERGRLLVLQFLEGLEVRFVVLAPDPKVAGKKVRLSGLASVETVLSLAAPDITTPWI